ncbi:hypothetical protein J6590_075508 [Homalodisca vitripennis]|nr:hypothetical protein J6590_075508 [Homalodisca vitripennis]
MINRANRDRYRNSKSGKCDVIYQSNIQRAFNFFFCINTTYVLLPTSTLQGTRRSVVKALAPSAYTDHNDSRQRQSLWASPRHYETTVDAAAFTVCWSALQLAACHYTHRLAIFTVTGDMFHDAYCDTRGTDIYLDAHRLDVCRGIRYVNACGVTLPILFDSGHLFYVYPTQPELPTIEDLVKENSILQENIADLKEQLRYVIDHTIENDKRLLQYTDQIFVVNSPQSVMTPRASVANFTICMDEQCVNGRAVINNLRTTVEVLEAELRNLRVTGCGKCGGENGGSERTVQSGKETPLQINNRPGAKLQTVNSDTTPPPGSCYVVIAGTNDLASGQQYNIYRHLELCITAKLKTAKSTPTLENCALGFYLIRRGGFTRHGMHFKTKSKPLLARHLVQCMQELSHIPGAAPSSPHRDTRRQSSENRKSSSAFESEPCTLPYETFAL